MQRIGSNLVVPTDLESLGRDGSDKTSLVAEVCWIYMIFDVPLMPFNRIACDSDQFDHKER